MWLLAVASLALANLAIAASPAAATYCSEDNLLRAFQHTPTPASSYCRTTTGYPTFLSGKTTTYPSSRLSSACSCFSRFPTEPTPSATPLCYRLNTVGLSTMYPGATINLLLTVDPNTPCGNKGYLITNACGNYNSKVFSAQEYSLVNLYNPQADGPDNCYYPGTPGGLDSKGVFLQMEENEGYVEASTYLKFDGTFIQQTSTGYSSDPNSFGPLFMAVSCATAACVTS